MAVWRDALGNAQFGGGSMMMPGQFRATGGMYGGYGGGGGYGFTQQVRQPQQQAQQFGGFPDLVGMGQQQGYQPQQQVNYTSAPIGGRPMSYRPIRMGYGQSPFGGYSRFGAGMYGGYGGGGGSYAGYGGPQMLSSPGQGSFTGQMIARPY